MGAHERDDAEPELHPQSANSSAESAEESAASHPTAGKAGEPRLVWVEDLAGPEDYWLTLTDAARVTRRQEVTIRRWVASGSLPIRNRPLGINKRTRHVRASDLARLSPIVDASATISGATAQVDLLSIPQQQKQILLQQGEVEQQLRSLTTQVEEVTGTQQRRLEEHHTRLAEIEDAAQHLQNGLTSNRQQAQKRYTALGKQLQEVARNVRRLATETRQVQEVQQALEATQERAAERQMEQEEAERGYLARLEQLEKEQARVARDREKLRRRLDGLAAQASSLAGSLRQVEERLADQVGVQQRTQEVAAERLELLGNSLAQLRTELQQERQQTAAARQQAEELQAELEAGRGVVHQLAQDMLQERQHLEQLTQQVATIAATIPARAVNGNPDGTQDGKQHGKPVRLRRGKQPPG